MVFLADCIMLDLGTENSITTLLIGNFVKTGKRAYNVFK